MSPLQKLNRLILNEIKSLPKYEMLLVNLVLTVIVAFLVGFIYSAGQINEIKVAFLDLDNSSTSQNIVQQFAENEKFTSQGSVTNYEEMKWLLENDHIDVGVILPGKLGKDVKSGKGSELMLIFDQTNYIIANSAYAKAYEMVQSVNLGVSMQIMNGKGLLPFEADNLAKGLLLEQKGLYNPSNHYGAYLGYGILGAGIFSLLMSAVGMTFTKNFSNDHKFSFKEIVSKLLFFSVLILLALNLAYPLMARYFTLPFGGAYFNFFLMTIFYALLISSFGLILFVVFGNEVRILQASSFFATTLFFISGFTWPVSSMPAYFKPLYYLCPFSPFLNGVRASVVMGLDFSYLSKYVYWLALQTLIYLPLALLLYLKKKKVWTEQTK